MAGGLARQLGFCVDSKNTSNATMVDADSAPVPIPDWCADQAFVQSLTDAQTRLWKSIQGAKDSRSCFIDHCRFLVNRNNGDSASDIYSEVWSYSFDNSTNSFSVVDLARLSPEGTESDAIQLWSYGFLGLLDPSTKA